MLRYLLGSESREQILIFLVNHQQGYATEIARFSGLDLFAIQQQLEKFEMIGLLVSKTAGRKRIYSFNPAYPLLGEITNLIEKALAFQPVEQPTESEESFPSRFRSYFWDYSLDKLSWGSDRELIIRRLLSEGSWEAVNWLRKRIGDDSLRQWLIAHSGRGLSSRQLRFWSLILDLPERRVSAWVRTARANPWSQR